jgi:hypothetical protein
VQSKHTPIDGGITMKLTSKMQITTLTILMAMTATTATAAKGGNGGGGKPDEGPAAPVLTVESSNPAIENADTGATDIPSHGVSSQGQAVFYHVLMDMTQFAGNLDSGPACDHGFRDGILVIEPKSSKTPAIAEVTFGFPSELDSLDTVWHVMTMEGQFDQPENWPPAPTTSTTVTLDYWEFSAENRKAQRQDCAGESEYLSGDTWTFTVTRQADAP